MEPEASDGDPGSMSLSLDVLDIDSTSITISGISAGAVLLSIGEVAVFFLFLPRFRSLNLNEILAVDFSIISGSEWLSPSSSVRIGETAIFRGEFLWLRFRRDFVSISPSASPKSMEFVILTASDDSDFDRDPERCDNSISEREGSPSELNIEVSVGAALGGEGDPGGDIGVSGRRR